MAQWFLVRRFSQVIFYHLKLLFPISAILDVRSEQNEEYLYLWHHLVQEALVHEKITECFGKLFFILGKNLSTSHSKQGLTYTSLLKGQVIRPPCPLNTLAFDN